MTATGPTTQVEFLNVQRLRFVETAAPLLTPEEQRSRDRVWSLALRANPSLFDGPVVACAGVAWEEPGELEVSWARVTYRHYALRWVPGSTSWLPSLFVNVVQPVDDGRLMVVRMSSSTAAPGRWQLPGGSLEPPGEREALDELAVRGHAARELTEETGAAPAPQNLRLWAVTRGGNRSVGLVYLAPPESETFLRERFAAVTAADVAGGREPELDQIVMVRSSADLMALDGPQADYLAPVVDRFARHPPMRRRP